MKIVITGSTGMVGHAVLLESIESPLITEIILINRRPIQVEHPKIKEIIHSDFYEFSAIQADLTEVDGCFFCLGVSSIGMKEEEYTRITFTITHEFAKTLHTISPNALITYVSGEGTDGSEKGRIMWARVKGRTENMLFNMGFGDVYAFQPGAILPVKGVKSKTGWVNFLYKISSPFFPLLGKMDSIIDSAQLGQAMIHLLKHPQEQKKLRNPDIKKLALTATESH